MAEALTFQIHLTNDCNLECLHCYSENQGRYLNSDEFEYILNSVLNYMRSRAAAPGQVIFCGGEPTLSPILIESIRKCAESGFKEISILTNGLLMTADFAGKLARAGCDLAQICIEGSRETHNEIRNGTYDLVLKAWDMCRANGMTVYNQTSVNPLNYKEIDSIIKTSRGRVDRTMFLRQIPHKDNMDVLTRSQWTEVLDRLLYGHLAHGEEYWRFIRVRDILWRRLYCSAPYFCGFSDDYPREVIIECNGDVHICRRAGVVVGNIFRTNLTSIYSDSDVLKRTRNLANLRGRCGDCRRRNLCGGCRGMALAVNGDIMAEDPHCALNELNAEVAAYLHATGEFTPLLWEAVDNRLSSETARQRGIKVSRAELQQAANAFRSAHGLLGEKETKEWLEAKSISVEAFEAYLESRIISYKVKTDTDR